MSNTVFANGMGFFHKGSGGKGVAPVDVCLTPPPPPAGPIPVPYVNVAPASDLADGSETVKVQGEPTALETKSNVSTSSGDEPATNGQGAGVVTHKIKGKASFKLWRFDVKVEGKGVCRHGDPMIQNTASDPPNTVNPTALTNFRKLLPPGVAQMRKCPEYDRDKHAPDISAEQDKAVHGKPCWECMRAKNEGIGEMLTTDGKFLNSEYEFKTRSGGKWKGRDRKAMTPDHQPPMNVAWAMGGCHIPKPYQGFKDHFGKPEAVKPHCRRHSNAQGSQVAAYARRVIAARK